MDEIAAYIDGETDPGRDLEIESHLANCNLCSVELNLQKHFLCSLNASLKSEKEIALPANFAKQIVANAEGTVSGLRRPGERYNAIFICSGLSFFVLFSMGLDKLVGGAHGFLEQTSVLIGFFGHIFYSVFVGIVVVLRSFAAQMRLDLLIVVALVAFFAISIILISRKIRRLRSV